MKKYITNKCVYLTELSSGNVQVEDVLGNSINDQLRLDVYNYGKANNLEIVAIEQKNKNDFSNPHFCYSIIIEDNKQNLFEDKITLLLKFLRDIEDLSFQVISGQIISNSDINLFLQANELELQIREGHINHVEYEKLINNLTEQNSKVAKALVVKNVIVRLGDFIRTELCHSANCILQALDSLKNLIITENKRDKFVIGKEKICYGYFADVCTWSFTDSIKSISTALDVLAKLVKIVIDIDYDSQPKIKKVLFGDLKHLKNWKNDFLPQKEKNKIDKHIQELQLLLNFRHEVTHNIGLFNAQNSIFVGYGTECINKLEVLYSDLLTWDYQGNSFCNAQKQTGFFTQQNNAISFTKNGLEDAILLSEQLFRLMRLDLLSKCKTNSLLNVVTLQYNLNKTISASSSSVFDLEKLIIV